MVMTAASKSPPWRDPCLCGCGGVPALAKSLWMPGHDNRSRDEYGHSDPNANKRRSKDKLWRETLAAYGGRCDCCGETEPDFLSIDHPDDDGASHRRSMRPLAPKTWAGATLYGWLRQQSWPEAFRLLCFNCQMATHRERGCPHQRQEVVPNGKS